MSLRRADGSEVVVVAGPEAPAASQEHVAPFAGRPVFVVIGMHRSGASVLAKMLQLLGVDMADEAATGPRGGWERPEIVAFNDRLLALIGRPLASPVHALPFPAGWWADPRVLALKREVQAFLRGALADRYGMWGFKDLRVTRLLPFWSQVFEEMGLRPAYLWSVRDPAESAASAVASGLVVNAEIAEAMWFIYNADAHKFVGNDAAAIVDYAAWAEEPARLIDLLLERLPLSWRGSHGELLECVREIASERPTRAAASPSIRSAPIHSPLVRRFYEAVRDPESSETSQRYRGSVTQAVDILRTLVAPYAALVSGGAAALAAAPPAPAADAGALTAALDRAATAEAAHRDREALLSREIEARVAENSWLQQQFLEGKRALAERDEALRAAGSRDDADASRLRAELEAAAVEQRAAQRKIDELHAAAERQRRQSKAELEQVRKELATQKVANEKYLSRIYELKAQQKSGGGGVPTLPPA